MSYDQGITYSEFFYSIDECSLLPRETTFAGGVHGFIEGVPMFWQPIKNKRHGIKLYMFSEPNDIILNIALYTGVLDSKGGKRHAANVGGI